MDNAVFAGNTLVFGKIMTRHYSTRDFFRQMPNAYLARYFAAREALQAAMKETKVDALFDAWMTLPEDALMQMESKLRDIADMSNPQGAQRSGHQAEPAQRLARLCVRGCYVECAAKRSIYPGAGRVQSSTANRSILSPV